MTPIYAADKINESSLEKKSIPDISTESVDLIALREFVNVFEKIKKSAVYPLTDADLFNAAIGGMLKRVDQYSELLNAKRYQEILTYTDGEIADIGVDLETSISFSDHSMRTTNLEKSNQWKVTQIQDKSPAANAGIQLGDLIIAVDNTPINELSHSAIMQLLSGTIGSRVAITVQQIRNKTSKTKTISLTRSVSFNKAVHSELVGNKILWLKVIALQQQTAMQINEAIQLARKKQNINGIILDLRDNRGGLLSAAVDIADLFLAKNTVIVKSIGRTDSKDSEVNRIYMSENDPLYSSVQLTVLINKNTASSAEILTAALKENGRAIVVGQQSYGKASIQRLIPLNNERAIKLTIAEYKTPKDHQIMNTGIAPDVEVVESPSSDHNDNDLVLSTAISLMSSNLSPK